jgi:hypothetical protein
MALERVVQALVLDTAALTDGLGRLDLLGRRAAGRDGKKELRILVAAGTRVQPLLAVHGLGLGSLSSCHGADPSVPLVNMSEAHLPARASRQYAGCLKFL